MVLHILSTAFLTASLVTGDMTSGTEPTQNIVEIAAGTGSFNTLVTAVKVAGLTETLKMDGPYTVFAPTDDAFGDVDPDALNALLADADALAAVLLYHVVPGSLSASDVLASDFLGTANGAQAPISLNGAGQPMIDDAIILDTDIPARNGAIHVIDRVIFPN